MARREASIIRAARTAGRENRLTDLLCLALDAHQGFALEFLRRALGQDRPEGLTGEVEASTQVRTSRGKFIDMEVLALAVDGRTVEARVWSEHKTGSRFSEGQMEGYASDLQALGGTAQLIAIVDTPSEIADDLRWLRFTWREVAMWAWAAGRDHGGRANTKWMAAARAPMAPAAQRILWELVNHLEEEHGAVIEPVRHMHVAAFAHMTETYNLLWGLLESAAEKVKAVELDELGDSDNPTMQLWQTFAASGTWAEPLQGYPELTLCEDDGWTYDRTGEPAFGAGYTLPSELSEQMRSLSTEPWRGRLEADGFAVSTWRGNVRVFRTLMLAEVTAKGATVDAQARALAGERQIFCVSGLG